MKRQHWGGVTELKDVLILRTSAEFPGPVVQGLLGMRFFFRGDPIHLMEATSNM